MHITTIFIWFILYSILGWIYETIYCSVKSLKWDNRGMLLGPYCPIYGVGAVLDVLLCSSMSNAGAVFFSCMAGSAVIEYVTSYTTERLFHAVWWDYSDLPFNIRGRICLPCTLGFGVAGLIVLYGLHPYMEKLTNPIPLYWQEPIALLFMAVFAADCALTADSLAQINVKLAATMDAVNLQISERYEAFIENAKQSIAAGSGARRERISLEDYKERRTKEELEKTLSTMGLMQTHAVRSSATFRMGYSELGGKMKHMLRHRAHKEA